MNHLRTIQKFDCGAVRTENFGMDNKLLGKLLGANERNTLLLSHIVKYFVNERSAIFKNAYICFEFTTNGHYG